MDAFEILGIPSTKDVKEIRRAYSKQITQFSPEKDPEGFQKLRAAYEDALLKAQSQEDSPKNILSPIDEFMKEFEENYRCFDKRLDTNSWEELLERDICYNVDSSNEINHRILTFIMDDYNFPQDVWILFNSHFSWTSKKDTLYKNYHRNFIDFLIYKINVKTTFDYEYLRECKDNQQDLFIEKYRQLNDAISQFDLYTVDNCIKIAQEICPKHPNLLILIGRYFSISGQLDEAFELFTSLIKNNKEDLDAFFYRAELYYGIGKLREAYDDYKMVINIKPDSPGACYALAKCCLCLKKYEEAIEFSAELVDLAQYRQDVRVLLSSAYNFYIDDLLKNIEFNSMDNNLKFKLADAYYKTSKIEESYNILSELMQDPECTSATYLLFCSVLMMQKNTELAYITICKAVDLFKDNHDLNFLKADILDDLGRYEESIAQYDKAIEIDKTKSCNYNNKAYVLNKVKRYNNALECANMAIELNPTAANSYKNKAGALLGLELYEDCLSACEEALSNYQYLTEVYIIKMKAFINMDLLDEALSVYNNSCDLGLKDSTLYFQKARVLMYSRKYKEAIDYCNLAIELDENTADFYYIKGLCFYYTDMDGEAIDLFDTAIKYDKENDLACYYKIKCLLNISKENEALGLTDQAINAKLNHLDRFHNLKGSILEHFKKYEEAIVEYKKAINHEPVASYYYSIGHAYNELDKYNQALEYYNTFAELEPNDVKVHVNMSYSLYNLGKYNECIECCNKAINIDPEYATAHQNKGWSLFKLNKMEDAAVECNIALKLDGNNEDILLLRLNLLKFRGLNQEALVVCDRILEINENNNNVKDIRNKLLNEVKNQKKGLFRSFFK